MVAGSQRRGSPCPLPENLQQTTPRIKQKKEKGRKEKERRNEREKRRGMGKGKKKEKKQSSISKNSAFFRPFFSPALLLFFFSFLFFSFLLLSHPSPFIAHLRNTQTPHAHTHSTHTAVAVAAVVKSLTLFLCHCCSAIGDAHPKEHSQPACSTHTNIHSMKENRAVQQ